MKQGVDEIICVKFLQVIDLFTDTDIFYRNSQFRLDGNCNTALCSTVKLGKDDTCNISYFHKLFCLRQRILSCCSV